MTCSDSITTKNTTGNCISLMTCAAVLREQQKHRENIHLNNKTNSLPQD